MGDSKLELSGVAGGKYISKEKCMCNSLQGLSRQMKIHEGSRKEEEVCSALYMSEL